MATRYEYCVAGAYTYDIIYGSQWMAQTFTPSSDHTITHLALRLLKTGSPGNLSVEVQATTSGKPNGAVLATATITEAEILRWIDNITSIGVGVVASLDIPLAVTASTMYAIVLHADGADLSNYIGWIRNNTNIYAGGAKRVSTDAGVNWGGAWSHDFMFEEWNGSPSSPTVTTQAVSNIGATTATGNGNITSLGDCGWAYEHGVCWDLTANPVATQPMVAEEQGVGMEGEAVATGAFTSALGASPVELAPETTYHARAYAVSMAGIAYGADVEFTTLATPTFIPKIFII